MREQENGHDVANPSPRVSFFFKKNTIEFVNVISMKNNLENPLPNLQVKSFSFTLHLSLRVKITCSMQMKTKQRFPLVKLGT